MGNDVRDIKLRDNMAEELAELKLNNPSHFGNLISALESQDLEIEELVNRARNNQFISSKNQKEGILLKTLYRGDFIDVWKSIDSRNPKYELNQPEVIREFKDQAINYDSFYWDKRKISATLNVIADQILNKETVSSKEIVGIEFGPSLDAVHTSYNIWNEALYSAGLEISQWGNSQNIGEEEIRERLRMKFHELQRIPGYEEFFEDENMPNERETLHCSNTGFNTYGELLYSEFPYRVGKTSDEVFRYFDKVEERDFEPRKWTSMDSSTSKDTGLSD